MQQPQVITTGENHSSWGDVIAANSDVGAHSYDKNDAFHIAMLNAVRSDWLGCGVLWWTIRHFIAEFSVRLLCIRDALFESR